MTDRASAGADLVGRHRGLARRTALVSALTLVSRVLGYVREILSAALFGDKSAVYDAFITAWRVPNLFRRFLGEGALSTSFQTSLTKTDGDHGEAAGRRLFADTLRLVTWILLAITVVVIAIVLVLPDAMPGTGWAWLGADPEPVRDLTARVMPFVVLVCISALVGGALQVRGHFASPAWAPAFLNVFWIASLVVVAAVYGWTGGDDRHLEMAHLLAWGVLIAGAVQLLVQVPALFRFGLLGGGPPPTAPTSGPRAMDVLKKSAPLAVGAAVYQINVMIDGLMAESLLENGGPTLHYYANRVQQFPMALIAAAATSAVFPALQAHGHGRDLVAVRRLHDRTQRAICFVALPASVGLWVLAGPVIAASFERGAFGAEGVERASAGLRMLTLAILPAGATGLVARTYYSLGDFKTPVRISIAMLVTNVGLNVVCIRGLGLDVDGLALATATTSWAGLLLLLPGLRRKLGLPAGEIPFVLPVARMLVAAVGSGIAARSANALVDPLAGRVVALLTAIAVGIAAYSVLAALFRIPEWSDIRERIARRATRKSSR